MTIVGKYSIDDFKSLEFENSSDEMRAIIKLIDVEKAVEFI